MPDFRSGAFLDGTAPESADSVHPEVDASSEPASDRNGFDAFGLDERVRQAIRDIGYEQPSAIQAETIPLLLAGRDVVGLAQTGTGKTAAFAVPALSRLAEGMAQEPLGTQTRILVLAPTRELALQVAEAFTSYAKHLPELTILPIYGGAAYGPQLAGLRRGAHVVIGTPGRIIDHLSRGSLNLSSVQYLVLDEADEMLRMGFAEAVEQILSQTPADKQTALFSATMPPQIRRIGQRYLHNPAEVSIESHTKTGENIKQKYLQVTGKHKFSAITRVLESNEHEAAIVFVRTKAVTEEVAQKLRSRGYRAEAINGDIPQAARERTVEKLRSGDIDILVATDVAARGLDVERITLVLNYDIPSDTESYVHRIGRTGRAGRTGEAILFVTPRERHLLRSIEKATRQKVEQMQLPSAEVINTLRVKKFSQRIKDTLETHDLTVFRELVSAHEDEHDVSAEDIAAALALMAQGDEPLFVEELPVSAPPERAEKRREGRDRGRVERGDSRSTWGQDRPARGQRRGGEGLVNYRIAVGHRQRVVPRAIVGALANEGNLRASEIGGIDIRADFTLVELPAQLTKEQWRALSRTRIGGAPIQLEVDRGPRRSHQR